MSSKFDFDKAKKVDQTRSDGVGRNVGKVPRKYPPTESQLELIATLKAKLENIGKDTSYLAEPKDNFVARHVINALIRLCRKYKV